MNQKLGLLFIALLLLASLIFGSEQLAVGFASALPGYNSAPKIPDHVLYESIFRLDLTFHKQASEQELAGQPITPMLNYFKEQLQLNEEENETLHRTALQFSEAVKPIDTKANNIVNDIRKQFPNGQVETGQTVPPPPSDLAELQAKRDSLVLDYRDRLQNALGSERFALVDDLVKNKFSKNFQLIEPITGARREK